MPADDSEILPSTLLSAENLRTNAVFAHAIRHSRLALCITDPSQPDEPIVFANPAFSDLTGYAEEDFIGKNCRFLQGPETTEESLKQICEALNSDGVAMVEIVNYRKSGEKFINALQIGPVFDEDGNLIFHFGSQMDISTAREKERQMSALKTNELLHRLKNIVNVMTVVIEMTGRSATDTAAYSKRIAERLRALGQAHFATISNDEPKVLHLDELAKMLLLAYAPLGEKQVRLNGDTFAVPGQYMTAITLLLHELATNAVKHGSLRVEEGIVDLTWNTDDPSVLALRWSEHNGPAVTPPSRESGSKIISSLVRASGGTLTFDWHPEGLVADLTLPIVTKKTD